MDNELKEYLEGMENRLNARVDNVHKRVYNAITLITEVKESLEREIKGLSDRVGVMSSRLDRIATGSHVLSRLVDWADRQDKIEEESLLRFQRIESRLNKLEKPGE